MILTYCTLFPTQLVVKRKKIYCYINDKSKKRKREKREDLIFKMFSEVPTSKTSFQIAVECNIWRPFIEPYQQFQFQKTSLQQLKYMHQLASLISKVSPQFQLQKNRFKYRQKAPFSVLIFISFFFFCPPYVPCNRLCKNAANNLDSDDKSLFYD